MPEQRFDIAIYHADCDDGFGAAWVARLRYEDIELVPVKRGEDLPDVTGRHVLLLDFAPGREDMAWMMLRAKRVLLLDHHQSGRRDLDGLPGLHFVGSVDPGYFLGACALFDTERSGVTIAWETFFGQTPRPEVLDYIEDHDLSRWVLFKSRSVTAGLRLLPRTIESWDRIVGEGKPSIYHLHDLGTTVLEAQASEVARLINHYRRRHVCGHCVPFINTAVYRLEACEALFEGEDFAVAWHERGDGRISLSFRSDSADPEATDVSKIAELLGGGGRRHAAGAIIDSFDSLDQLGPSPDHPFV